ncbi:amidase [Pelagicoccus albus]|uniref:Amidase n=1 Tax=Pelagicoccus albus TaxID=415222 RepID=A0A7X1B4B7_9BACT|nr:amidase [Pelagicoccus albus]MBC2605429.1 amidase [Pelagicoccus albus]
MNLPPLSIRDWSALTRSDPELAATTFLNKTMAIPKETHGKVIASLPELEWLTESFERSAKKEAPLAGVPFMLKDLFDFPGYPTTASSSFLSELRPTPTIESALSKSFRAEGAVYCGKTHLNEFAYGLSGENPYYGDCPHPLFPERLSGGSSSGSAWIVKSGIAPIATGTDTGGSIRVPAAWCGIYGLRLSPSDWSTKGCFPLAPTFDTPGWFTATAADMITSVEALIKPASKKAKSPLRGVSLLETISDLSPAFRAKSLDTLETLNAQSDPSVTAAFRDCVKNITTHYSVLQSLEALKVHSKWLDSHKAKYDPAVWQRIDRARNWSEQQKKDALAAEEKIKAFFGSAFEQYDFIALPATQSPAITASQHTDKFRSELLSLTAPGSFARCPVLTLPIQLGNGESQGIQILYKDDASDLPIKLLKTLIGAN